MFTKRDYVFFVIIGFILGFVVVRQFYLYKEVTKISKPEESGILAMEVAELVKSNKKLNQEVQNLTEEHDKLSINNQNEKTVNEMLEKNLKEYMMVLGLIKVEGSGVIIQFDEKINSTQLVDLINALKNIGAEALAINNKRIAPNSSIEQGSFFPPIKVEAIGKPEILEESLTRSGGIIEQIGSGTVYRQERIILPSI